MLKILAFRINARELVSSMSSNRLRAKPTTFLAKKK